MAARKKQKSDLPVKPDAIEMISRLLAIIAVKEMDKEQAALRLLAVGFDSPQIGDLLSVNPNFANAAKSRAKKNG